MIFGGVPIETVLLCVGLSAILNGLVIYGVRKRMFSETFSVIWMAVSFILLILPLLTPILKKTADILKFDSFPSMLFTFASIGLLGLLVALSVQITRLSRASKDLAQELAILNGTLGDKDYETSTRAHH